MLDDVRITVPIAPLNASRTAQRAIPATVSVPEDTIHLSDVAPSFINLNESLE